MPVTCPKCAAEMPDEAAFCPNCGDSTMPMPRVTGKVGALSRRLAGALAYFTLIPAVLFLLVDPYKRDRFVRFHSFQCLLLWAAGFAAAAAWKLFALVLSVVPLIGHLLALLIAFVAVMALALMWLVIELKALQGVYFKIPFIGDFAERLAGET